MYRSFQITCVNRRQAGISFDVFNAYFCEYGQFFLYIEPIFPNFYAVNSICLLCNVEQLSFYCNSFLDLPKRGSDIFSTPFQPMGNFTKHFDCGENLEHFSDISFSGTDLTRLLLSLICLNGNFDLNLPDCGPGEKSFSP